MIGLLAAIVVLVPPVFGIGFAVTGLNRGWAPWPWLVGAGFAVIPAAYLSMQSLCHSIGGSCPSGDELHSSHLAVIGLVLLLAGMALAVSRSTSARRPLVLAVLLGLGELWTIDRLHVAHLTLGVVVLAALLVIALALDGVGALRPQSR